MCENSSIAGQENYCNLSSMAPGQRDSQTEYQPLDKAQQYPNSFFIVSKSRRIDTCKYWY